MAEPKFQKGDVVRVIPTPPAREFQATVRKHISLRESEAYFLITPEGGYCCHEEKQLQLIHSAEEEKQAAEETVRSLLEGIRKGKEMGETASVKTEKIEEGIVKADDTIKVEEENAAPDRKTETTSKENPPEKPDLTAKPEKDIPEETDAMRRKKRIAEAAEEAETVPVKEAGDKPQEEKKQDTKKKTVPGKKIKGKGKEKKSEEKESEEKPEEKKGAVIDISDLGEADRKLLEEYLAFLRWRRSVETGKGAVS